MVEIKGIDVSRWNGAINWKTVADCGIGFAILRITEKNNIIDPTFEPNYNGCVSNHIPVGVYKYSYATTVTQIKTEANVVIQILKKRKLDYPVFLDLEDKCQENLPKSLMLEMINAFRNIIIKAGYKFGIYTGIYWYDNKIPEEAKKYDIWVARYPYDDTGIIQERLRPSVGVMWQFSSKGHVNGISGNVDMNVSYKDYAKTNNINQEGGTKPMSITKEQAINALIKIAEGEVGYLEKKSNSQLDDKTANAGSANYTKYWRDLKSSWNGQAWCAVFVSWCFYKAFGMETAKTLLKHPTDFPYVYCPTLGARFTKYANPEKGDVVIFYRNGTFAHTGIVTKVEGDRFWTIEGNTSGGSTIIANGGGVCAKTYLNSQLPGTKFCRPDYSIVKAISIPSSTPNTSAPSTPIINKTLNKTTKYQGKVTATSLNVRQQPTTEAGTCSFSPLKKGTVVNVCDTINDWLYISYNGKYGFVSAQYVSKTTNSTLDKPQNKPQEPVKPVYDKWVGCCYKASTTVFSTATGQDKLSTYPKLGKNNLFDVVGEERIRYKIVIAGKYTGYISKDDVRNSKDKYPRLGKVVTKGGTLNLRKAPINGAIVKEMPNGSGVTIKNVKIQNGEKWYEVKYSTYTGYASAQYIKEA